MEKLTDFQINFFISICSRIKKTKINLSQLSSSISNVFKKIRFITFKEERCINFNRTIGWNDIEDTRDRYHIADKRVTHNAYVTFHFVAYQKDFE